MPYYHIYHGLPSTATMKHILNCFDLYECCCYDSAMMMMTVMIMVMMKMTLMMVMVMMLTRMMTGIMIITTATLSPIIAVISLVLEIDYCHFLLRCCFYLLPLLLLSLWTICILLRPVLLRPMAPCLSSPPHQENKIPQTSTPHSAATLVREQQTLSLFVFRYLFDVVLIRQ